MTINEINAMAKQIKAMEKEIKELKDTLRAETKAHGDEIKTDDYKLTIKIVISDKFDITRFKNENPDTAAEYTNETIAERFTISGVK